MAEFQALWDTGATNSAISQDVIDTLGLRPSGFFKEVSYADGSVAQNVPRFLVNIMLPNNVEVVGLPVMSGKPSGSDVLIGMDIISRGDFAVTHMNGKTKFSFRVPSQGDIDFVVEYNQAALLSRQSSPSQHKREQARRNRRKRR